MFLWDLQPFLFLDVPGTVASLVVQSITLSEVSLGRFIFGIDKKGY